MLSADVAWLLLLAASRRMLNVVMKPAATHHFAHHAIHRLQTDLAFAGTSIYLLT
jgi:hypothetical protein